MSVIARRVAASPARTGTQTWEVIRSLLFSGWPAPPTLASVAGPASATIAEGVPASAPFVLTGAGPRVRVYCLYGDDALDADEANETNVGLDGSGADWTLAVPCHASDLEWMTSALAAEPRAVAYDAAVGLAEATGQQNAAPPAAAFQIDTDLFNDL